MAKLEGAEVFPGVTMTGVDYYGRNFRGTSTALIAAGLVAADQLPGQPGMGKVMVSFMPDGSRVHKGGYGSNVPGHKRIRRSGNDFFIVAIQMSPEERERQRQMRMEQRSTAREALLLSPHLTQPVHHSHRSRGHLRLVWSAPQ